MPELTPDFIQINYRNFLDAVEEADQQEFSFDSRDPIQLQNFIAKEEIDTSFLMAICERYPDSALTCIGRGLMRGLYLSWPERESAGIYVNTNGSQTPLRPYDGEMAWDVAISYTFDGQADLNARLDELTATMRAHGLRVYLIRPGDEPNDCLWQIRYREAIFHSHFHVSFLTTSFLSGRGTIEEMFSIALLARRHRKTEDFYPLIPLVVSTANRQSQALSGKNAASIKDYDEQGFDWVRTHPYAISLDWGPGRITDFFLSLRKTTSTKVFDPEVFNIMQDPIRFIEFLQLDSGDRRVRVYIEHPLLTYYLFAIRPGTGCRWQGCFEPSSDARDMSGVSDPIGLVRRFLDTGDIPESYIVHL